MPPSRPLWPLEPAAALGLLARRTRRPANARTAPLRTKTGRGGRGGRGTNRGGGVPVEAAGPRAPAGGRPLPRSLLVSFRPAAEQLSQGQLHTAPAPCAPNPRSGPARRRGPVWGREGAAVGRHGQTMEWGTGGCGGEGLCGFRPVAGREQVPEVSPRTGRVCRDSDRGKYMAGDLLCPASGFFWGAARINEV